MHIRFDGRRIPCRTGDTIASALHREGTLVLGRSLRYHRPRGLFCNTGSCASCLVEVDGEPNVLACMRPAGSGQEVRSQNRLGTARRDLLGAVDKVYRQGFDPHDAFTRPRLLNEAFLKAVRLMSGLGRAPPPGVEPATPQHHRHDVDVLVVGGGTHGLQAALEAVDGAQVVLIDDARELGGDAAWDVEDVETHRLARLVEERVQVFHGLCFGIYGPVAAAMVEGPSGLELHEFNARRIVVATGSYDAWPLFPNNDLPGILSLRGARRLLAQGVTPGRMVAVHGSPLPDGFARRLAEAGGRVVAQGTVEDVRGDTQVERVQVDGAWHVADTVISVLPRHPRVELLQQAGHPLVFRNGALRPAVPGVPGTTAAGAGGEMDGASPPTGPRIDPRFTEPLASVAAIPDSVDGTEPGPSSVRPPQEASA